MRIMWVVEVGRPGMKFALDATGRELSNTAGCQKVLNACYVSTHSLDLLFTIWVLHLLLSIISKSKVESSGWNQSWSEIRPFKKRKHYCWLQYGRKACMPVNEWIWLFLRVLLCMEVNTDDLLAHGRSPKMKYKLNWADRGKTRAREQDRVQALMPSRYIEWKLEWKNFFKRIVEKN